MDILKSYTLLHSAYLTIQSLPLLLTPSLILSLLNTTGEPRRLTDLETYLSRALAFALLAFAATCLVLTDVIPVGKGSKSVSWADESTGAVEGKGDGRKPYAQATLIVMTAYHAVSAFYLYMQQSSLHYSPSSRSYSSGWNFGFTAGLVFSSLLFCIGVWVLLFGGDAKRLSKTTGADKRTGNFPFTNVESSKEIKKKEKREKERDREGDSKEKRRSLGRTKSRDA